MLTLLAADPSTAGPHFAGDPPTAYGNFDVGIQSGTSTIAGAQIGASFGKVWPARGIGIEGAGNLVLPLMSVDSMGTTVDGRNSRGPTRVGNGLSGGFTARGRFGKARARGWPHLIVPVRLAIAGSLQWNGGPNYRVVYAMTGAGFGWRRFRGDKLFWGVDLAGYVGVALNRPAGEGWGILDRGRVEADLLLSFGSRF